MNRAWLVAMLTAFIGTGAHAQELKPNPNARMPAKPPVLGAQPAPPPVAPPSGPSTTTITIITTTTPQQGAGVPNTDPRLADPNRDRLMQDSQRIADDVRRGDSDAARRDSQQFSDDFKQKKADDMKTQPAPPR